MVRALRTYRLLEACRVLLSMAPPFVAAGVVLSLAHQSGGPVAFCGQMLGMPSIHLMLGSPSIRRSPSTGPFVAYGGL